MTLATEHEIQHAYRGDGVAGRYVAERFLSEPNRILHDRQAAAVRRAVDRLGRAAALEVAPGPGRLTRAVRPAGTLTCLEFNEGMIAEGRRVSPPGTRWVRGNAFRLPFAPGAFGLLYSFRFVRHFRGDDRRRLYAEFRRVLAPGGAFLLDAVNETVSGPLRRAHPEDYPVYDELYTADGLRGELAGAGFADVALEPVQRWHAWQYASQVYLGPRANWLNRLVVRALDRLPGAPLEWIVTCRRA